jgi:Mg2+-importing ATPase
MDTKNKIEQPGLTDEAALKLLREHGENVVVKQKKAGPFFIFLSKLTSPLFILMIGISLVSFAVGQRTSALIVLAMIFLSATLDFMNTYKSQKVVEKLVAQVATKIIAIRGGEKKEIDIKAVVPGDILFLSAGNIIPADCRMVESDNFFVNQATLTGESIPVEKIVPDEAAEAEISPDNLGFIFMGTSVVSGFATVKVLTTGAGTEFGKVASELNKADPKTDFEINITKFSIFIMKVVFYMVSFVFVVYLIKNAAHLNKTIILEAFTFALAITIGVTPDMLPAIITVCLSRGSQLMAKKKVIVKQLSAIENFGSMDILCTDKTGTLTQDHIALVKYEDYEGQNSGNVLELGHLSSHFHTGAQNPLDTAVNDYREIDVSDYEKIDEIPYDFTRKRSSMIVEKNGRKLLITKGAPEEIISICESCELGGKKYKMTNERPAINRRFENLSTEGFRVLGLSYKVLLDDERETYGAENETEMIFAGFLAFLDPPKESAAKAISELKNLGVEVKILTGDNDLLAQKICRDIGIAISGVVIGSDLEKMNDLELEKKIMSANIFARVTPVQKERIILLLKKMGKTVSFLGDGINDAPALKAADVGISVNNAADIAKDTADIILLEKSLESLKDGIIEGRKTFHNTLKYVLMGLSSNFGNMFSMMGAVTFLPFLPMLPAQILFNNFVYDASQFSLPTDAVDEDELLKPAHWDLKFIRSYMIVFGWMSSIFDFLTFFLLYYVYHLTEHQFQTGWFIESIATQIFVIYIIRTKKIPFLQSRPSRALFITTFLAVVIAWSVQYTPFGKLMQFERLPFTIMAIIASYVVVYLGLVEIAKRIFYKLHNKAIAKRALAEAAV